MASAKVWAVVTERRSKQLERIESLESRQSEKIQKQSGNTRHSYRTNGWLATLAYKRVLHMSLWRLPAPQTERKKNSPVVCSAKGAKGQPIHRQMSSRLQFTQCIIYTLDPLDRKYIRGVLGCQNSARRT